MISSDSTKAPKAHNKSMGRDKFKDLEHPFMPAGIPSWQKALSSIERRESSEKAWPYWIPEPALLLPAKEERCQRYMENWIRARNSWLFVQANPQAMDAPAFVPQEWREFLNRNEKTGGELEGTGEARRRKQTVFAVVDEVCGLERMAEGPAIWYGREFVHGVEMGRQVVWELFEVGFRAELRQLHAYHRQVPAFQNGTEALQWEAEDLALLSEVFPDRNLLRLKELPGGPRGLGAVNAWERATSLEALRKVFCTWPSVSQEIAQARPLVNHPSEQYVVHMEGVLTKFYAQAFWNAAGRPPILPHRFPSPGQ